MILKLNLANVVVMGVMMMMEIVAVPVSVMDAVIILYSLLISR